MCFWRIKNGVVNPEIKMYTNVFKTREEKKQKNNQKRLRKQNTRKLNRKKMWMRIIWIGFEWIYVSLPMPFVVAINVIRSFSSSSTKWMNHKIDWCVCTAVISCCFTHFIDSNIRISTFFVFCERACHLFCYVSAVDSLFLSHLLKRQKPVNSYFYPRIQKKGKSRINVWYWKYL